VLCNAQRLHEILVEGKLYIIIIVYCICMVAHELYYACVSMVAQV